MILGVINNVHKNVSEICTNLIVYDSLSMSCYCTNVFIFYNLRWSRAFALIYIAFVVIYNLGTKMAIHQQLYNNLTLLGMVTNTTNNNYNNTNPASKRQRYNNFCTMSKWFKLKHGLYLIARF